MSKGELCLVYEFTDLDGLMHREAYFHLKLGDAMLQSAFLMAGVKPVRGDEKGVRGGSHG